MSTPLIPRAAIVGTAGHIDHGKTALIRRLTGVDTDRLPEERKRGISIELGFAFLDLPGGGRAGVVDVPGHERFVKQMLAGAGGMDLIVLVVAADEGVMPQTREHLEIANLLQIPDGFVVVTKTDLAPDPEWLEVVESDIADAVAGTLFAGTPILRASAKTGEGVDAIRDEIARRLAAGEFRARGRETRLPVDRVFTMQGFGTVVTGTLWSGTLRAGDPVTVLPEGIETRVKSVQVHDHEVEAAGAGQRVAVSLHRVEKEKLHRGDWIVRSDVLRPSPMMDGWLAHLASAPRPMKNRARVRVHLGASEILARVVLLDRDELRPGDRAPVQLRLEAPGVAESGDRFVVRSYSPMRAIGGGVIVEPVAAKRRRLVGDPAEELRRREAGTPADRLVDLLLPRGLDGESAKHLRAALGLDGPAFAALATEARDAGKVVGENRLFLPAALDEATSLVEATVAAYHADHPVAWGISLGDLKSSLGTRMNPALFDLARERLVDADRVVLRGELVRLADHDPTLTDADEARAAALLDRLDADGFAAPFIGHVIRDEGLDEVTAHDLLARLDLEGRVVPVSNEFVYTADRIEMLRERLREHFTAADDLTVAAFKELGDGLSRKHAVPLMEFCDRRGWTRRSGDGRVMGPALRG